MKQHIYLMTRPIEQKELDEPPLEFIKWQPPQTCPFHPLPGNMAQYYGYLVYDHEVAAGKLIKFQLEAATPKEWALYQFWQTMGNNGLEATVLKTLWERSPLKQLRKQFKDPAESPRNRRMAWAALILRGKADLSHIKHPDTIKH